MLALSAFVAISVAAGLGGVYRPGGWIPISVTLSNEGPHLEGVLEVEIGPSRVSTPVALSAPSRKRFDLALPAPRSPGALLVRLRAAGQELEPSSFDLEPLPPGVPLEIHLLTKDELLLRTTPLASALSGARLVSLTPEEVPERFQALGAARAVVSSQLAFEALREPQQVSLRRWSRRGGRLLVEGTEVAAPLFDSDFDSEALSFDGSGDDASARRSAGRIAIVYLASVAVLQIVFALGQARLAIRLWITFMGVLAFAVFLAAGRGLSARQRSVVHVLPGGGEVYVESRVSLDFGRRQTVSIEAVSPDVVFDPTDRDRGLSYRSDADGRLRVPGDRFRWERETLRVSGFLEAPFASDSGRLSNLSASPLRGCSLVGPDVPRSMRIGKAPRSPATPTTFPSFSPFPRGDARARLASSSI
jgi:hypothetical protein